jgi:hypothetical protein
LESREVIVVEALKQAKDEHVQKLMEAYLVTRNQRRALRIQELASSNPGELKIPRFLKVTRCLPEERRRLGNSRKEP